MPYAYTAVSVTLTSADTNYNVMTLVRAIDANAAADVEAMSFENDSSNASGRIRVGDINLSASRCAYSLGTSDSREYPRGADVGSVYARGTASGMILNIEIMKRVNPC